MGNCKTVKAFFLSLQHYIPGTPVRTQCYLSLTLTATASGSFWARSKTKVPANQIQCCCTAFLKCLEVLANELANEQLANECLTRSFSHT